MYRLYTEDVNRAGVESVLNRYFPGYTLYSATGYWQGVREPSLIIEVTTNDSQAVRDAAEGIRVLNRQQSVMLSHLAEVEETEFISAPAIPQPQPELVAA